jgi:Ca2+-binding EF-hand superfamily protein
MEDEQMRKFLVAGALAAIAVPLLAQPTAPVAPARPMADKIVTRAEVDAKVRAKFARLDANRDGFLTTEEMAAGRGHRMANRQANKGAGHAMRDPNAAFDRLDANRDGMINRDEFARARQMRMEKRVVMNRDGATPGQPGAMRGKRGGMMGGGMLKMADANNDGRVTLQEATSGAMRHFDMVDTNRDGRITPEERRAGRGMMRQMRGRTA